MTPAIWTRTRLCEGHVDVLDCGGREHQRVTMAGRSLVQWSVISKYRNTSDIHIASWGQNKQRTAKNNGMQQHDLKNILLHLMVQACGLYARVMTDLYTHTNIPCICSMQAWLSLAYHSMCSQPNKRIHVIERKNHLFEHNWANGILNNKMLTSKVSDMKRNEHKRHKRQLPVICWEGCPATSESASGGLIAAEHKSLLSWACPK